MQFAKFVKSLPEVSDELIAKAKRVDQLREMAEELEMEVWGVLNTNWTARELAKADPSLGDKLKIDPAA